MITGLTLEWFLRLVDRLIALATATNQRRARVFSQIIIPLWSRLETVAADYFKLYTITISRLRAAATSDDYTNELQSILADVRQRRDDFRATRVTLIEMERAIRQSDQSLEIVAFAEKVEWFFFGPNFHTIQSTQITGMIQILQHALQDLEYATHNSPSTLVKAADQLEVGKHYLEERWADLSASFADLQLRETNR